MKKTRVGKLLFESLECVLPSGSCLLKEDGIHWELPHGFYHSRVPRETIVDVPGSHGDFADALTVGFFRVSFPLEVQNVWLEERFCGILPQLS